MKFKITCRPRIRNSVAQKFISSSLAIGLLLNNTSASLASVLSEDGRYETFEGSNITIPDILEEDRVDVEIEGNTMVNVANQKDPVPITKSYTVEETNHIPLQGEYDGKARPIIEGNTVYYNNDTGELTDTFIEGANLSLVSSFEDQVVTQEMIDTGLEDAENLGKYRVEYKTVGKNKLNVNVNKDTSCHGVSIKYNDDKTMTLDGVATNAFSIPLTTMPIKYDTSKKYLACVNVISGSCTNYRDGASWSLLFYVQDGTNPGFSTGSSFSFEFTPKVETYKPYIWLGYDATSSVSSTFDNFTFSVQILEADTSDTSYEPYKESLKTLYLNSPLLEGDTIEDVDGEATHIKRYNQIVIDGSDDEEWFLNTKYSKGGQYVSYRSVRDIEPKSNLTIYCDKLKYIGEYNGINDCIWAYNDASLVIQNSTIGTIEEFKQWLLENPITVVYPLAEPIYETVSDESILCDSYVNGHLNLNSNIPVNRVDFIPTNTNLNYLYPSTEYTVQFESDNKGKIDRVLLGDEVLYSNFLINKGINKFNIVTPSTISSIELILDGIGFNLSKLIVTQPNNDNFDYFEGMKSVGQDDEKGHKIEIITQNNLADIATEGDTNFEVAHLKAGKTYSWKSKRNDSSIGYNLWIRNEKGYTIQELKNNIYDNFYTFTAATDGILYHNGHRSMTVSEIMLVEGTYTIDTMPSYKPYVCDKKDILLTEPLRRLPNGVKDRIIKRNGQWVVERNCDEVVLDGNEKWGYYINMAGDARWCITIKNVKNIKDTIVSVVSDKLPAVTSLSTWNGEKEGICQNSMSNHICIYLKNFNKPEQLNDFKQWLSKNPIKVTYQLKDTVYEPINYSSLTLYNNTTHVSANSIVPANMKITVDRTLNRAVEHIELAKVNPTMANLSLARMWVNLINDSVLKDQLQNEVNSITNIDDLQLERKSASSNLDVYVKSQNMLSMSLNTNSVTFDGYSGTEDMEKLGAVNISINSSLPYSLNAYMPSEIVNADKSEIIPIDILNIREESEGVYQTFDNNTDKVILKDNCNAGNGLTHDIDLKLSSNLAHKADVYKTVIKFEAEQK